MHTYQENSSSTPCAYTSKILVGGCWEMTFNTLNVGDAISIGLLTVWTKAQYHFYDIIKKHLTYFEFIQLFKSGYYWSIHNSITLTHKISLALSNFNQQIVKTLQIEAIQICLYPMIIFYFNHFGQISFQKNLNNILLSKKSRNSPIYNRKVMWVGLA